MKNDTTQISSPQFSRNEAICLRDPQLIRAHSLRLPLRDIRCMWQNCGSGSLVTIGERDIDSERCTRLLPRRTERKKKNERLHRSTGRDDACAWVAMSGGNDDDDDDSVVATLSDVIATSCPYLGSPLTGRSRRPRYWSPSVLSISLSLSLDRGRY